MIDELDRRPGVAVVGPRLVDAAGRAELSFGRMVGPFNELRQKMLARGHAAQPGIGSPTVDRRRDESTSPIGSAGPVCWSGGATPTQLASSTNATSCTWRTSISARRSALAGAMCCLPRRRRWFICAANRPVSAPATTAATARAYRRSQIAFYAKHHPGWVPLLRLYLWLRGADTQEDGN